MMKVFLSADMEGTCGIVHWNETDRATPMDYAPLQKQMTREVAAACRGALAAGAEEVMVKDAHDSARNIDPTALPRHPHASCLERRSAQHDVRTGQGQI